MASVLITGGSRGIGAAAVRAFAARGDRVTFFMRKITSRPGGLQRRRERLPFAWTFPRLPLWPKRLPD